ncbi:hypothetical protein [Streptomyces sp. NPDC053427]|uniref:hypothetical protein n=1 Tax=Streptomyces sp. NPDC053427 TaxID=3365701 RepID=UPI0037D4CD97
MGADAVPRREVVTGEPQSARGSAVRPAATAWESTPYGARSATGDPHLRDLMRRQLRAALLGSAALTLLLGLLPLLLPLLPAHGGWPGGGVLAWGILGVAAYPALVVVARWYIRRAERNEAAFAELADGS